MSNPISSTLFPVTKDWANTARVNQDRQKLIWKQSSENPNQFWTEQARRIDWISPFSKVSKVSFHKPVQIQWYDDGILNVCFNCVDRHLPHKANQIAYRWVPEDESSEAIDITYQELSHHVNRLGNALKELGVKKGDRVTLYMPMIPEAVYSMLACARIGAIHSVIFGGFAPNSIADRVIDAESDFIITADFGWRGAKKIPLKENVNKALAQATRVKKVLVVKRTGDPVEWNPSRDCWYHEIVPRQSPLCPIVPVQSTDPLFILYTSGSTGKPKGVLHSSGGYLVYASLTHEIVFDYRSDQMYWCAADIGWITGHTYIVYGPLANGATSLIYEGLPTCPTPARMWQIVDQHKVNILYTAPTLLRALMREGDAFVNSSSRQSLKLLGSVGEPINPEAWNWYYKVVGNSRCPIVDTWWQTETGGVLISPLPGATALKPGSASFPLFDIGACLLNDKGEVLEGEATGHLCLSRSWPGQMQTVFNHHSRFEETYFSQFPGYYYTGDECHRDKDGYLWIIGRADDVINVSGHRLGTAEIESALVSHHAVAESAVVGFPHPIKGQGIYAFVSLKKDVSESEGLKKDLIDQVRKEIGGLAAPDIIQWAPALPKTRSGKIMRRILKKIAGGDTSSLGDTTTLADPSVVDGLMAGRIPS